MYVLKSICFMCLSDKNALKTVIHGATENGIYTQIKDAIPEFSDLDSRVPIFICSACHTKIRSFYTFKKKCLKNYNHFTHYIQLLQGNNTQDQNYAHLQIKMTDNYEDSPVNQNEQRVKQEQPMNAATNIKQEMEDPGISSNPIAFTGVFVRVKEELMNDTEEMEHQNFTVNNQRGTEAEANIKEETREQQDVNYQLSNHIKKEDTTLMWNEQTDQIFIAERIANINEEPMEDTLIPANQQIDQNFVPEEITNNNSGEQIEQKFVPEETRNIKQEAMEEEEDNFQINNQVKKEETTQAWNQHPIFKAENVSNNNEEDQKTDQIFVPKIVANVKEEQNFILNHQREQINQTFAAGRSTSIKEEAMEEEEEGKIVNTNEVLTPSKKNFASIKQEQDLLNNKREAEEEHQITDVQIKEEPEERLEIKQEPFEEDQDLLNHKREAEEENQTTDVEIKKEPEEGLEIKQEPFEKEQDLLNNKEAEEENQTADDVEIKEEPEESIEIKQEPLGRTRRNQEFYRRVVKYELPAQDVQKSGSTNSATPEIEEYKCVICNEVYPDLSSLQAHMAAYSKNLHALQCPICKKKFKMLTGLNKHLICHLRGKKFQCVICKRKFASEKNLESHMKLHDVTDFECSICHKKFVSRITLYRHLKLHLDISSFECAVCGRKFKTQRILDRHFNLHFGIKDYECYICDKKFTAKFVLKSHMATHSDARNFECSVCHKKFLHKTYLNRHFKRHQKRAQ